MELQSIRQKLKLSRKDLAFYLGISPHTVKSIELKRREVPLDSLDEKADLIKGLLDDGLQHRAATYVAPATSHQRRKIKYLQLIYRRRLNNYSMKLKKMQENYVTNSTGLVIIQQFAESLAAASTKDNRARLRWTKARITEFTDVLKANNPTAQEMLALEIAGLEVRIARLKALLAEGPTTSR